MAIEINYGQLNPWFSAYPAGYELSRSGFHGLRMYSNIVARRHWSILLGAGTFIGREKWWRKILTEQDIFMGTESRVDSRLNFHGLEMMLGIEKRFFRDKVSLRGSQGLVHMFSVRTKHVYTFGYSNIRVVTENFPYHLPTLNTMTVLAASYKLDALMAGLEVGLSLQHMWLPMNFLMSNEEGGRRHYLIQGRYVF